MTTGTSTIDQIQDPVPDQGPVQDQGQHRDGDGQDQGQHRDGDGQDQEPLGGYIEPSPYSAASSPTTSVDQPLAADALVGSGSTNTAGTTIATATRNRTYKAQVQTPHKEDRDQKAPTQVAVGSSQKSPIRPLILTDVSETHISNVYNQYGNVMYVCSVYNSICWCARLA